MPYNTDKGRKSTKMNMKSKEEKEQTDVHAKSDATPKKRGMIIYKSPLENQWSVCMLMHVRKV